MEHSLPARPRRFPWLDAVLALAIFSAAFYLFWKSPVITVGDSKYTLLVTQNLLSKGGFALDDYAIPRNPEVVEGVSHLDGSIYQIEIADGHLYDRFPPGTAILSAPFVLVGDLLGVTIFDADHRYDEDREGLVQHYIASLLMAALAVIFYGTARLLLPVPWSLCVALGSVLGTQVWSTASRALWSHTWGIALLGSVLWLLLAQATGRRRHHPILLATLLSWTYFVRPTNSIFIVGITVYLLVCHRERFLAYAATGAAWFAAFAAYSWTHFHRLLPGYYQANRLEVGYLWEALAGNLISPSRGLLVFVPVLLFVFYLLARHWRGLPYPRLVRLSLAVSAAYLLAISCFIHWFGGWSYGPRFTTELVPWFALLAVLGVAAALRHRADPGTAHRPWAWWATLATGAFLLLASVLINCRGATAPATARWNEVPVNVDFDPTRVWDWRHPQMLAGLVPSPTPAVFPPVDGRRVTFGNEAGRAFEWDGWSGSDPEFCWTEEHWATLVFTADDLTANHLHLDFGPYLHPKRLRRQHIDIRLNDQPIAYLQVDRSDPKEYDFTLPAGALRHRNVLTFRLPDATSPEAMEESQDERTLGIALRWLELTR